MDFEQFLQYSSKSELVSFIRRTESYNKSLKAKSKRKTLEEYYNSESEQESVSEEGTNTDT